MLRNQLAQKGIGSDPYFHWRGGDVSRLEGFSDAVFGFAITLLVISLEVPKTFKDLLTAMRGFVAFGICFYILYMIWERHYTFFRRYGLQDMWTLALNGILLFVLLLYVYPMKFIFTLLTNLIQGWITNSNALIVGMIEPRNLSALFAIYGVGFAVVFGIFALFHVHAYRYRDELELTEYERHATRSEILRNTLMVCIGLLSVLMACALGPRLSFLAGLVYFLMGGVETLHGAIVGKAQRSMKAKRMNQTGDTHTAKPSETPRLRPDYGIDAPGVVRNLALFGGIGLLAAAVVSLPRIPIPLSLAIGLRYAFLSTALSLLGTAGAMVYGSKIGKLKEREQLLDCLSWQGDESALDVGCGRGLMLTAVAKRLTTGKAIGVDIWQKEDQSGNSPAVTRQNVQAEGVADRVEILDGDARQLPFPDCSFDVITSSWVLHNIYDPAERRKAVKEIMRVLKPGGQLALMDINHAAEYAQQLREDGFEKVTLSAPRFTFLIPTRTVIAIKPQ